MKSKIITFLIYALMFAAFFGVFRLVMEGKAIAYSNATGKDISWVDAIYLP